jgi:ribonuclease HII
MLMSYDAQYRGAGIVVAGMDEVGRGPLAGNVVTACVVMPETPLILWVDDSKKLSESRREKVYEEIMENALYVGIGQVSPEEIDEINILQATKKAMRMAAESVPADIFLIDAVTNLGLKGREIPLIKGDATSYSIAAASIVAKVTRDRQMAEADRLYPQYGFARNKGYGTKEHTEALRQYGPCPLHRRTFIGNFV